MQEPARTLTPELLSPRARLGLVESSELRAEPREQPDIEIEMGRGSSAMMERSLRRDLRDPVLEALRKYVTTELPWVSRTTGEPVGMWVEDVGYVEDEFEPVQIGTPYVWVGVESWDAADAVVDTFYSTARITDAEWIGGWVDSVRGFRRIKIYPEHAGEDAA